MDITPINIPRENGIKKVIVSFIRVKLNRLLMVVI